MRIMALATLIFLANSVMAESVFEKLDRFYVGGGVNFVSANTSDSNGDDLNFTTVELHGGYKYNGFLGGEARLGFGITDEEFDNGTISAETNIQYHASLYWRPETVNEIAKLYGLLGFSTISVSADNGTTDETNSEGGLSYGGGVGFVFQEDWNLNFEYRLILDKENNEFSAFSANVDYRF